MNTRNLKNNPLPPQEANMDNHVQAKRGSWIRTATTMLLCMALMISACTKEGPEGEKGAKGDKGDKGDKGEQGIQGIPGNAGVKMYVYGSKTIVGNTSYDISVLTADEKNNSLMYAYFSAPEEPGTFLSVPGKGWNFATSAWYDVVGFIDKARSMYYIYLLKADNTNYLETITWNEFRIIVVPIPAANIITRSAPAVDYSNYSEVAAYYGFAE